jgi:cytochrome P450
MTLPNGPKTSSLLQLLQLRLDPPRYLETVNQQYPDLFALKSAWNSNPLVIVNHPQALRQIFTNETGSSHERSPIYGTLYHAGYHPENHARSCIWHQ